ncbi:S41 family peptidase [Tenacibaculum sp. TC6]|uniref:S41 family peptidase n=1 Tax=Tenacibaculum sp. TC6 TaxID=3423223 RepID=UPI003D364A91
MKKIIVVFLILLSFNSIAQTKYQEDFDYLWTMIHNYYAYFDQKQTNWSEVKEIYQKEVAKVTEDSQFIRIVENTIYELYDAHAGINRNLKSSFRLIPTSTDAWIQIKNNKYYIADIRSGFEIEKTGLKVGAELLRINNRKIEDLVKVVLPKSFKNPKNEVKEFFANLWFAGKHNEERDILVLENGKEKQYHLNKPKASKEENEILSSRIIENNIGYVKINNSLGNNEVIKAFPKKVDEFRDTKAIIVDLRDTPSGGNTEVAKSIMGKFISETIPYQMHERVGLEREFGIKRSWIELLTPLKKPYKKPVIVLVGRWTGSVGEAIAQGFDNIKSATVVGTEMAKLLGAIQCDKLPNTKINVCFPVEKLFHVNGTPREKFIPEICTKTNEETYKKAIQILNE